MGYGGLTHSTCSDNASDFAYVVFKDWDKQLSVHFAKEMDHIDNDYNTDGIINIALFIKSYLKNIDSYDFSETRKQAEICKLKIAQILINKKDSLNGYHKKSYKNLIKSIDKWIDGN
jgi:hypothetical protein